MQHIILWKLILINLDTINCVGLNATGDIIASASSDMTVKLWDVKTGKVVHLGATADRSNK